MTNFDRFHFYLKDLESPSHFIDWNFYFAITSTLGRKVWISEGDFPIFPNMYLIFVGPPAAGKSLPAKRTTEILSSLISASMDDQGNLITKNLVKTAPDSVTLEALFRALANSTEKIKLPPVAGKAASYYSHASMSFCIGDELGTLFKDKSGDLITFMTQGWDCGNFNRTTKTQGVDIIQNMCINLLGCCTQDWIRRNIDASAVDSGFTSRVIFIYGEEPRHRILFLRTTEAQKEAKLAIQAHLKNLCKLHGTVHLSEEATKFMEDWVQVQDKNRINKDNKLIYYYGRKKVHVLKLALAIHFGESLDMTIQLSSIKKAFEILGRTELQMHKAMASTGRNDLASLADEITSNLRVKGHISKQRIYVDHYQNGNVAEIDECLNFLIETAQIAQLTTAEGKLGYKLIEIKSSEVAQEL